MSDVKLYTVNIGCHDPADDDEEIFNCLTEEERKKALRFKKRDDRLRSAYGSRLVRYGVDEALCELGFEGEWESAYGLYGKPFVKDYPEIEFSLSHSGDMVILAVSSSPVGADVEKICDIGISEFDSFLNEREKRIIAEAGDPLTAFYRIWTARESFAKMTGRGLAIFEDEEIDIDHEAGVVAYSGKTYRITTLVRDGHVISVCADSDRKPNILPIENVTNFRFG